MRESEGDYLEINGYVNLLPLAIAAQQQKIGFLQLIVLSL